jgi:glycosyltransferase involved in cell wall biosynthesis
MIPSKRFGVSVAVCCFNSAKRICGTLAHLGAQEVSSEVSWELLLIDNASTDETVQVALECWERHPATPLRVVSERRQGLAYARERALAEANFELVCFVDDDNWLASNWVQLVASTMRQHPEVGVMGGASMAACESPSPAWFESCSTMYAVSPNSWTEGECDQTHDCIWGAGMTIRRTAWKNIEQMGVPALLRGRLGKSLAGGEDAELCYRLRLAGWKLWYEPRLQLRHFMPTQRLTWRYVRELYRGSGAASAVLLPYVAELNRRDERDANQQHSWSWQMIVSIYHLLRRPRKLIKAALRHSEGDLEVLDLEMLYGRLMGLLRIRSYYRGVAQVRKLTHRLGALERNMNIELSTRTGVLIGKDGNH